jgi:hypothetical protein
MKFPRSAFDQIGGMYYFARMLDKIRLKAAGELPAPYHENMGKAMDLRTCKFMRVQYAELEAQVLAGKSDDEVFAWCQANGRDLNDVDLMLYNGFGAKRGLRDEASAGLERDKAASGLAGRDDIQTFYEYFDADEKRR